MTILEAIAQIDTQLLLAVNARTGNAVVDFLMVTLSRKWVWIPLYAALGYLIFRKFGFINTLWVGVSVAVLLILTDQGSVQFFKENFERSRPCHNPDLQHVLNLVSGKCGGKYGFISSHASNVFGLATLVSFMFRGTKSIAIPIFLWAALVSFSRVYLAVHYPMDVFVGAVYGLSCGLFVWWVLRRVITI